MPDFFCHMLRSSRMPSIRYDEPSGTTNCWPARATSGSATQTACPSASGPSLKPVHASSQDRTCAVRIRFALLHRGGSGPPQAMVFLGNPLSATPGAVTRHSDGILRWFQSKSPMVSSRESTASYKPPRPESWTSACPREAVSTHTKNSEEPYLPKANAVGCLTDQAVAAPPGEWAAASPAA